VEACLLQARETWSTWPLWKKLLLGIPIGLGLLAFALLAASSRKPDPAQAAVKGFTEHAARDADVLARDLRGVKKDAAAVVVESAAVDDVVDIYADAVEDSVEAHRAWAEEVNRASSIPELEALADRRRNED